MKIETKKAKFFYSTELNTNKFNTIMNKAHLIRDFKNEVSNKINSDLILFSNMTKNDTIKYFNTQIPELNG